MNIQHLDLLTDPSFIVNKANVITWANDHFLRTFGLEAGKVIGKKTCEEVCGNQLCGTKSCPVDKAARLKKPVDNEIVKSNGDGHPAYYQATATPVEGGKELILVALRETTEEKQLEARLRQVETDLNVIPTPIMEIDTDFTVTFMNPAGASVVGMTPEEVEGKKCFDLFKTPHCNTEKCACARAMQTDGVVTEQTI
ncbi:MAG: PAS domain-containing protein, partial [Desulfobacteraceae bacterium]